MYILSSGQVGTERKIKRSMIALRVSVSSFEDIIVNIVYEISNPHFYPSNINKSSGFWFTWNIFILRKEKRDMKFYFELRSITVKI